MHGMQLAEVALLLIGLAKISLTTKSGFDHRSVPLGLRAQLSLEE
jgi:hypothetical protein